MWCPFPQIFNNPEKKEKTVLRARHFENKILVPSSRDPFGQHQESRPTPEVLDSMTSRQISDKSVYKIHKTSTLHMLAAAWVVTMIVKTPRAKETTPIPRNRHLIC